MLAKGIHSNELIERGCREMNSEFRLCRSIWGRERIREKRVARMTSMVASDEVLNAFVGEETLEE